MNVISNPNFTEASLKIMTVSKSLYNKHKTNYEIRQRSAIYAMFMIYVSSFDSVASWQYYADIPFCRHSVRFMVNDLIDLGYIEKIGKQHQSIIITLTGKGKDLINESKDVVANAWYISKGTYRNTKVNELSPSRGE